MLSSSHSSSPGRDAFAPFFGILRTSPESLHTAAARSNVRHVRIVDPQAEPVDAQLISRQSGLWAVTTEDELCISQARGAACASQEEAVKKGVLLGTFEPPAHRRPQPHAFQLQGLVPDRVKRVLLVIGTRQRYLVDVRHNVFSIQRDEPVHLIRLLRN